MRNKWVYGAAVCVLAAAVFTGCGDGSDIGANGEAVSREPAAITAEPVPSDEELSTMEYEQKYNSGEFTMEDYNALAALYEQQGMIRKQRDMLEESYRIYGDAQTLEVLQEIAVNLEEEDADISSEARTMLQNLEISEYQSESVHMIASEEWFDTMMPKLARGVRNYFLQDDGQMKLFIKAGYDQEGNPFSQVWYYGENGQITFLSQVGSMVQVIETSIADGNYNGDFISWTVDSVSGDIRKEQGTFANGIYTGDYTAELHHGETGSDPFDLWSNRENMEYTVYTGRFDERGKTTLEQPDAENLAALVEGTSYDTCVVYAYDEAEENGLYAGISEGTQAADYVFGIADAGLAEYPVFTAYEVAETGENNKDAAGNGNNSDQENGEGAVSGTESGISSQSEIPQIRIYDGQIQYLDGNTWVSVGSVAQYLKDDPFRSYAEQKTQTDAAKRQELSGPNRNHGVGSIQKESTTTQKPDTTQQPDATQKPASTQKPTTTQKPTSSTKPSSAPNPTPAPPQDDNNDSGDNGGSDNSDNSNNGGGSDNGGNTDNGGGSDNGGNTDNGGGSDNGGNTDNGGGADNSGGSNGGDVDIEWTDDIM